MAKRSEKVKSECAICTDSDPNDEIERLEKLPLFADPRAGQLDAKRTSFDMLDLWRVHLEQCPDCGRIHGGGSVAGRPERHIYEYTGNRSSGGSGALSEDLFCALCGEVFQSPVLTPCSHHFCSLCVRNLLSRTAGRAACPLDGHALTRFAMRPAEPAILARLDDLLVRCPVCNEEIRKGDLHLHLQDPVRMLEEARAYDQILRPFYMSCPLSNFTVGEFNGSSALIRFYKSLGASTMEKFILTTSSFIVLPDPKMGFQPHSDADLATIREIGGYFNAWWVHPSFRQEVWWVRDLEFAANSGSWNSEEAQVACTPASSPKSERLLGGQDCSAEPWAASSFVHTWSSVRKPSEPRYLCCLRDLRGDDLPVLKELRSNVLAFVLNSFGASEDETWIFAHYPSSARYSTLHFHIIFGKSGSKFEKFAKKLERPHQLSRQFSMNDIIKKLEQDPLHFQNCPMSYFLGDKADLMDPISAFFGCSPHRYLQDFTFEWDPSAVNAAVLGVASSSTSPSQPRKRRSERRETVDASANAERFEKLSQQVTDLRTNVGAIRQSLDQLHGLVSDLAKNQHMEQVGASRLALLQLADLPSQRSSSNDSNQVFLWSLTGAFVGGLTLASLAVVTSVVLKRR